MMENILYALDIYNDAAHRSLYVVNQQFLYKEIEAEANLVFDQFIYLISDTVYSHYKEFSASCIMDISYKSKMEEIKHKQYLTIPHHRFETAMAQRNIQLLGRTIDLNYIIGQHISNKLYQDMESYCRYFESLDATALPELKVFLDILRDTHSRLSEHVELIAFDSILMEVNESFTPTAFLGRIVVHFLRSIITDIIPNYTYNLFTQRFVPAPVALCPKQRGVSSGVDSNNSKLKGQMSSGGASNTSSGGSTTIKTLGYNLGRAYDIAGKLTRHFFGRTHIQAFLSICGKEGVPLVVQFCVENLLGKLEVVREYMEALKDGIPPCKLPKFVFRTGGCYAYFQGKLKQFVEYEGLQKELFQAFREIGNTIAFLRDLSDTLDLTDIFISFQEVPILDRMVSPPAPTGRSSVMTPVTATSNAFLGLSPFDALLRLFQEFGTDGSSAVPPHISSVVSEFIQTGKKLSDTYKTQSQSSNQKKSLLHYALEKIKIFFQEYGLKADWRATCSRATNGALEVEDPKEFHRLWSAMNFAFCDTADDSRGGNGNTSMQDGLTVSDPDEFGHGFAIAGCAIVHILDQKNHFELLDFSYHVLNVKSHDLNVSEQSSQVRTVRIFHDN